MWPQATARQAPRELSDALGRLERAASLLRRESGGIDGNVCNLFAAFLRLLAAARSEQVDEWSAAMNDARNFLSAAPDHQTYYGPALNLLREVPDAAAGEKLLSLVPYF